MVEKDLLTILQMHVRGNQDEAATTAAANSQQMLNTTRLDLSFSFYVSEVFGLEGLSSRALEALANLPYLENLTDLDLSGNRIDLRGIQALATSACIKKLHRLRLARCNIREDETCALAQSATLSHLKVLDLSNEYYYRTRRPAYEDANHSWGEGAEAIATSPHLSNLIELKLSGNQIYDYGAIALANSPYLRQLEKLDLSGCGISVRGAKELANSLQLTSLHFLALVSNWLEEEGIQALAEGTGLPALKELSLGENGVCSDELRYTYDGVSGQIVDSRPRPKTGYEMREYFKNKPGLIIR